MIMSLASIIYITTPDRSTAEHLAQELVKKRLAACVQIDGPIKSVYHWKGELEQDQEFRLSIKSLTDHYKTIESFILKHHPYDTPEIVSVPIEHVSSEYLEWIKNETQ